MASNTATAAADSPNPPVGGDEGQAEASEITLTTNSRALQPALTVETLRTRRFVLCYGTGDGRAAERTRTLRSRANDIDVFFESE